VDREHTEKTCAIAAHLRISGFACDPNEITKILGVQPDKIWRRGEALTYTNKGTHKDNGWEITSSSSDALYVENHIADMLHLVLPVREQFKSLPAGSSVMLICGISMYPDGEVPSIFFDAETLRVLGEINADLDIDLCCGES